MPTISAAQLHRFVAGWCAAGGSEPYEAELVADHLVRANLTGHDSHGVGMLPHYAHDLDNETLVPNRQVEIMTDSGAVLALDGQRGYGQVVAKEALDLAVGRARELGACVIALRNSHHVGRIGHWAEQCAAAGMASVHFVNVVDHDPLVCTFGGSEARLGTNPFCAAFPGEDGPLALLDMATSKIALGKVRVAMNKRVETPKGALLDAGGRPTRDPNVMFSEPKGGLVAFGEHKGSGLAVMCEIFAGVLTGAWTIQPGNPRRDGIVNHMLAIVIHPAVFGDPARMRAEAQALRGFIEAARPTGEAPPMLPGDPERRHLAEREAEGIPVDDGTWAAVREAAGAVGMPAAEIDGLLRAR
jgi:uncharacterized oxidoreductase